ncbi:hypothetical protein FGB62_1g426 [Gracilaria domingensis]|nr:hypothetical protein FGB62_1g426 [Gracilaria domingensis]
MLAVERIANKSYQLEEDEDAVSTTSAIYLSSDGTLSIGKTDGPTPEKVRATWEYSDSDGEILVEIERFYEEGNTKFSVKRVLRGHLDDSRKNLIDLPVFSGGMYQHPADFSANSEMTLTFLFSDTVRDAPCFGARAAVAAVKSVLDTVNSQIASLS